MCRDSVKVLSRVPCGELSFCSECRVYHLEFNNIYLELRQSDFKQFKDYLINIEMDYWEDKYACAKVQRKIPIPSMQPNLVLMFKREEIKELQSLFNLENRKEIAVLSLTDIDYTLILN